MGLVIVDNNIQRLLLQRPSIQECADQKHKVQIRLSVYYSTVISNGYQLQYNSIEELHV